MSKEVTPANVTRGALALLVGMYVVDSIPNASQLAIIFPLAGAVASSARARSGRRIARAVMVPPDVSAPAVA
jgi:hypothetical protein